MARPKNICTVEGCGKFLEGRGLCKNHYEKWRRKAGINHDGVASPNRTSDSETLKRRFDRKWKPAPNGCWQWIGTRHTPSSKYSYQSGEMVVLGKKHRAHRISWRIAFGEPAADKQILHKCDNSLCVNPDHLYLGTSTENMRDMSIRERTHWKKISNELAQEIRNSDESNAAIARRIGVHRSSVRRVRIGVSKRHINHQPPPR